MRDVSPAVREAAKQLRGQMTQAEKVLWEHLRRGLLGGLKWRRQHAIERFVLDFYCAPLKLCVELDGGVHDQQREHDEERTIRLARHGIRVIRFRNEEVMNHLDAVLARIRLEAAVREPQPAQQ